MEETEFEHIAARLRPLIMDVSGRFFGAIGMDGEAEDVVQDVMFRLWKMRHRFGEIQNPEGWAVRIAKNGCVSRYREMKRYDIRRIDDYELTGGEPAEKSIDDEERQALLARLMDSLPKATRRILYMRNVEGMTLDEIAVVCGRPKTSIKSSITTAKKNILEQLKRQR